MTGPIRLLVDTGVIEVIEQYAEEIAEGMDVGDMPEEDINAIRLSGSTDPRRECQLLIRRTKREIKFRVSRSGRVSFAVELSHTKQEIERNTGAAQGPRKSNAEPRKRRLFKGVGGVAQGALLTAVDVSLLVGWWSIPVGAETATVGSLVSIVTGIGTVMTGVGDLRGE